MADYCGLHVLVVCTPACVQLDKWIETRDYWEKSIHPDLLTPQSDSQSHAFTSAAGKINELLIPTACRGDTFDIGPSAINIF